jgi:hypothetical protein
LSKNNFEKLHLTSGSPVRKGGGLPIRAQFDHVTDVQVTLHGPQGRVGGFNRLPDQHA